MLFALHATLFVGNSRFRVFALARAEFDPTDYLLSSSHKEALSISAESMRFVRVCSVFNFIFDVSFFCRRFDGKRGRLIFRRLSSAATAWA